MIRWLRQPVMSDRSMSYSSSMRLYRIVSPIAPDSLVRWAGTFRGPASGSGTLKDNKRPTNSFKPTAQNTSKSAPNASATDAMRLMYHQVNMNKRYIEAISAGDFVSFNEQFDRNRNHLSLINIITVLYHYARYRHKHLSMAAHRGDDLAQMYLSQDRMAHVLQLLRSKAATATADQERGQGITGQSLGNLFYSLYGTGPHHLAGDGSGGAADEVSATATAQSVELLQIVSDLYLAPFQGFLQPREVANTLYGLQCFSGDGRRVGDCDFLLASAADESTRRVYGLLTPVIERSILDHNSGSESIPTGDGDRSAAAHFSSQDVGLVLYGLKSNSIEARSADNQELGALMDVLARKIAGGPPCSSQSIGSALFGLRSCSSEVPVVRALVSAINSRICAPVADVDPSSQPLTLFNAQNVSNSLYGLQSMSTEHPEVRELICTLTRVIRNSIQYNNLGRTPGGNKKGELSPEGEAAKRQQCLIAQHVGNSLYGLQNMCSSYSETRELLSALTPLLKTTDAEESILPQNIDNALFGLKNMSSKYREVRKVLSLLDIKIHSCCQQWDSKNIARAMYGLQNMSSHHSEVRDLLASLTVELSTCSELTAVGAAVMSSQSLGNILAGLQCMSSDHTETREFLSALLTVCQADVSRHNSSDNDAAELLYRQLEEKEAGGGAGAGISTLDAGPPRIGAVTTPPAAITSQNVGMALYGLQNMTPINSSEVVRLLNLLTHWVETGSTRLRLGSDGVALTPSPVDTTEPLRVLDVQAASTALYGLQQMPSSMPEVSRLLDVLTTRIAAEMPAAGPATGTKAGARGRQFMSQLDIGRCLYGMQNMRDTDPAVTRLCAALLPRMRPELAVAADDDLDTCGTMTMQSLASSFYGLRNMGTSDANVRGIMGVLAGQMQQQLHGYVQRNQPAPPVFMANILYGIQSLVRGPEPDPSCKTESEPPTEDERKLMTACAVSVLRPVNGFMRLLAEHGVHLTMLQTGKSLNGILEISDDVLSVEPCLDLFEVLCSAVEMHTGAIVATMSGGGDSTEIKNYQVTALYQSLLLATHSLSRLSALDSDIKDRLFSCRDQLHSQLHTFDELTGRYVCVLPTESVESSSTDGLEELGDILRTKAQGIPTQGTPSSFERPWILSTKRLFAAYPDIIVESRVWLHGFEADLVITVPTTGAGIAIDDDVSGKVVINVELDGPHHQYYPHKQRFTRLRDEYLQQRAPPSSDGNYDPSVPHNVFVVGIPYQERVEVSRRVAHKRGGAGGQNEAGKSSDISSNSKAVFRGRATRVNTRRPSSRDVEQESWRQRALWHHIEPVLAQFYDVEGASCANDVVSQCQPFTKE